MNFNAMAQVINGFLTEKERLNKEKKIQKLLTDNEKNQKYNVKQIFDPKTGQTTVQLETRSPMEDMIQQGNMAKAQMNVYEAGGPAPTMFGGGGNGGMGAMDSFGNAIMDMTPFQNNQQKQTQTIQAQGGLRTQSQPSPMRVKGLDAFGRPTGYEPDPVAEQHQKEVDKRNVAKKDLQNSLESFFAVDDQIRRGSGFLGRTQAGLQTMGKALDQSDAAGFAAATHDAAVKNLRVKIVRAAGDVGNLNIVEQKAAEEMIPGKFDAIGTAQLKRAYLAQMAQAINSNDPNLVKMVLSSFMANKQIYKGPSEQEAQKLESTKGMFTGTLSSGVKFKVE